MSTETAVRYQNTETQFSHKPLDTTWAVPAESYKPIYLRTRETQSQQIEKPRVAQITDNSHEAIYKKRPTFVDESTLNKTNATMRELYRKPDESQKSLVKHLGEYITKAKVGLNKFITRAVDKVRTIFGKSKKNRGEISVNLRENLKSDLSKEKNNRLVENHKSVGLQKAKPGHNIGSSNTWHETQTNLVNSRKKVVQVAKSLPELGAPTPNREPKPDKDELLNTKPISKLGLPRAEQEPKSKEKVPDLSAESSSTREVSKSPQEKLRDLRPLALYSVNLSPKKVEKAPEITPKIVEKIPEQIIKEKSVALKPAPYEKKPQISRRTSKLVRRTALGLLAGMALSPTVGSKIDTYTSSDRNTGGKHLVIGETPKNESKLDSPQRAQVSVDTNKGRTTVTFSNVEKKNSPKDTVLQPPVEHKTPRAQVVVPTTVELVPAVESAAAVPQTSPEPEVTQVAEVPPAPVPEAVSVAEAAPERAPEIVLTEPGQVTAELARQIMNNPNISVVRGEDGDRVWLSLQRLATNNGITFKYDVDKIGIDEVLVQPQVLRIYLDLAEAGFKISVNSLTTSYEHSKVGHHPMGEAGDVGLPGNNNGPAFEWLSARKAELHIVELLNEGNHVHWGVEKGVPVEVRMPNPAA